MNKTLKWIIIVLVAIILLFVLLNVAGVIGKDEGAKVSADKVEERTIIQTVNASGKIYPEVEVKLSPDISGEIVDLYVEEGDSVVKGQVLAQIYGEIYVTQREQAEAILNQQIAQTASAKANVAAQKAQLEQARKTYEMQKQLFEDKVISQNEFNTAEAAYKTAQANYNAAQQSLNANQAGIQSARAALQKANKDVSLATLRAPMSGIISNLSVKEGERVVGSSMMAGTEMMRIADMSKIEVRVDVGENDIPKVQMGDSAIIEVDAYNDKKFKGVVTQISTSSNNAASGNAVTSNTDVTNYKVYIRIDPASYNDLMQKPGRKKFPFRPGMSASAEIQTQTKKDVLSVPITAVTTREKKKSEKRAGNDDGDINAFSDDNLDVVVFVVEKDTVNKKSVATGIQDINYIEIIKGLEEGEKVVTGPYDVISKTLKEGEKVKVVSKEKLFSVEE